MRQVLLDTSAYSALLRGHLGIKEAVQKAELIALNPVVLGELRVGFLRGGRQAKNEAELSEFLTSPRVSLVGIDGETAERYAAILDGLWKAGTPVATNDLWIAASAMQHGLAVLTTDSDFLKIPQILAYRLEPVREA